MLTVKAYSQVDTDSINSMINRAISTQSKITTDQLKEIKKSYTQLQSSFNDYK